MKVYKKLSYGIVLILLSACSSKSPSGNNLKPVYFGSISKIAAQASVDQCANGGVVLEHGIDRNGNGELDGGEVTGSDIVCHGSNGMRGNDGQNGATSLITLANESPTDGHCTYGGTRVGSGLDTNSNGTLETSEILSRQYVCHGEPGAQGTGAGLVGPTGVTGPQGLAGATGQTGPQGGVGATGSSGADGNLGLTGPKGGDGSIQTRYTEVNGVAQTPVTFNNERLVVTVNAATSTVTKPISQDAELLRICGDQDGCDVSVGMTGLMAGGTGWTFDIVAPRMGPVCRLFIKADGNGRHWAVPEVCVNTYRSIVTGDGVAMDYQPYHSDGFGTDNGNDSGLGVPFAWTVLNYRGGCVLSEAAPNINVGTGYLGDTTNGFHVTAVGNNWSTPSVNTVTWTGANRSCVFVFKD